MTKKITINGIKVTIVETPEQTGEEAAQIVLAALKKKPKSNFGFSTGTSPKPLYKELIKDRNAHNTDWSKATGSNLDEWTSHDDDRSCYANVNKDILDHLNLAKKYYFPQPPYDKNDGDEVEKRIKKNGGYDLMVLGLGVNGHLAFCEPGTAFDSRTGVFKIALDTIKRYEKQTGIPIAQLPKYGFGVGLKTINEAKKVLLIAFGEEKAEAIKHALYDVPGVKWPVSSLQLHPKAEFVLDSKAAKHIKEISQ